MRFHDSACESAELPLTIRYDAALPELDFTESVTVQLHRDSVSPTMLFFAAFDRPEETTRFRGIELADDRAGCVDGILRVDGLQETPLLLTTVLAANWRDEPLYQRLR